MVSFAAAAELADVTYSIWFALCCVALGLRCWLTSSLLSFRVDVAASWLIKVGPILNALVVITPLYR